MHGRRSVRYVHLLVSKSNGQGRDELESVEWHEEAEGKLVTRVCSGLQVFLAQV